MPKVDLTNNLQQLIAHLTIVDAVLKIGFTLINQEMGDSEKCMFPILTIDSVGVKNATSLRMEWTIKTPTGDLVNTFSKPLTDEKSALFTLPQEVVKDVNEFLLFVTISGAESPIAQGIVYTGKQTPAEIFNGDAIIGGGVTFP